MALQTRMPFHDSMLQRSLNEMAFHNQKYAFQHGNLILHRSIDESQVLDVPRVVQETPEGIDATAGDTTVAAEAPETLGDPKPPRPYWMATEIYKKCFRGLAKLTKSSDFTSCEGCGAKLKTCPTKWKVSAFHQFEY